MAVDGVAGLTGDPSTHFKLPRRNAISSTGLPWRRQHGLEEESHRVKTFDGANPIATFNHDPIQRRQIEPWIPIGEEFSGTRKTRPVELILQSIRTG
jgi:hypothetical protein